MYLLTVPLLDEHLRFLSIYVAASEHPLPAAGTLLTPGDYLDIVLHDGGVSRATNADLGDSELSAHPLVIDEAREDVMSADDQAPWAGHKLGGRPYLVNSEDPLADEIESLLSNGYSQALQFDFPANKGDAAVSGPWPFVNGMFHLLIRSGAAREEMRWFFEL